MRLSEGEAETFFLVGVQLGLGLGMGGGAVLNILGLLKFGEVSLGI